MIPGLGRSPGGGHGNPLQYSRLENPTDTGARQATVHGVLRSQTQLNDFHFISEMHAVLFDIVFVFFFPDKEDYCYNFCFPNCILVVLLHTLLLVLSRLLNNLKFLKVDLSL